MTKVIQRFPRPLESAQGAALARLFWTDPETRIRVAKDGMSINFVFSVRIREEAKGEPFQPYWAFFFVPPADRFEKLLQDGYNRTQSGKKPVHRHICNFLRRAFVNAFEDFVGYSWQLPGHLPYKELEQNNFSQQAKIEPGPQPNPADAVKVFQLYQKRFKMVKDIRNKLKRDGSLKADRLLSETDVPPERFLKALRAISKDPAADLRLLGSIGAAEIARKITELEITGIDFGKVSFIKHQKLGKKLLDTEFWKTNQRKM
jgi:hypothetical protein